jgi:type IV pilus assembly protein PilE
MTTTRTRGFTLIELMVVIAVVGTLAAIALPAYRNQVIRTNRSAAQQVMQDMANREEQFRLDARAYTATVGTGGLAITVPGDVSSNYTPITPTAIAAGTNDTNCDGGVLAGPAYRINATAVGSQAIDGDLCLDSVGLKRPAAKWQR